ncbi:MAG: hypothetical protein K0S38_180 [Candidatus Paceibacter sp.]|jgi:hypothetical protein|nr:hypothetical protein [Candidatus Paceibacter sp.]
MDDKRRGEIAYLYMKYAMRYQTPLGINVPVTSFTSTRWSRHPIEPWQMSRLIDDILADLKEDKLPVPCLDNQELSAVKRGKIALQFVIKRFEETEIILDEDFRSGLQRFCNVCKVPAKEGRTFFCEIISEILEKKRCLVFDERDWSTTKAFM